MILSSTTRVTCGYVSVSFLHGSVFPCVHMSEGSEIGFDLTDALLQMNQRF